MYVYILAFQNNFLPFSFNISRLYGSTSIFLINIVYKIQKKTQKKVKIKTPVKNYKYTSMRRGVNL